MLFHSYIISELLIKVVKLIWCEDLINYCQITALLLGQALAWLNVYKWSKCYAM